MKKILASLLMVIIVGALTTTATKAYFSDTETSTGNTFATGTLNLKVDDKEGADVVHVTFNNVLPAVQWLGAEYDHQWVIKNDGTIPGHVTYTIKNIKNFENGCNTAETIAGDTTCATGEDQGELGSQYKLLFQLNQPPYGYNQEIYPVGNVSYTPDVYHLNAGETKNVYLRSWFISAANNNLAQGDSLQFDIEFKLEQD